MMPSEHVKLTTVWAIADKPTWRRNSVTNRTEQHQTASLAKSEVQTIFNTTGAAVDSVQEDYGEDLLVQPCLNGEMDHSRLWIQVKGTSEEPRHDPNDQLVASSVWVTRGHLARWVGTADLVVLVRWHVPKRVGWFCIIQEEFSEDDLFGKSLSENVRIDFSSDCRFDTESACAIAWSARQHSAAQRISRLRAQQALQIAYGDGADSKYEIAIADVTMRLMTQLGILQGGHEHYAISAGVKVAITEAFGITVESTSAGNVTLNDIDWKKIFTLALLIFMNKRFPTSDRLRGLSGQLLGEMCQVMDVFIDSETKREIETLALRALECVTQGLSIGEFLERNPDILQLLAQNMSAIIQILRSLETDNT